MPTGEDIQRFLTSIASHVKGKSREVPAFPWLCGGLRTLISAIRFSFKGFKLDTYDAEHIEATIESLHSQGLVTKEPAREKHWVGAFMVRRLVTALLQDALGFGTMNWDVTISKALSIVLQSALSARTGDILRNRFDNQDLPFICYKDVIPKLVDGDGIDSLVGRFTIRNAKGYKRARNMLIRFRYGCGLTVFKDESAEESIREDQVSARWNRQRRLPDQNASDPCP